jgi:uncharacterized protein
MDRRTFLSNLVYSTAGIAVASSIFSRREGALAQTSDIARLRAPGYGELVPTAAKNTGETVLKLPKGFEYNVIGRTGKSLSDGRTTPRAHDGMATFNVKNELRVIRNHEVNNTTRQPVSGIGIGAANHYDETCGGGTTTLVIDPRTRTIVRDWVSLSGTLINCSGGPTPWGSWVSCEETTLGQTVRTAPNGTKRGGFPKPHGYCFEVFASSDRNQPAVPLTAMGRFEHEAIAVDPKTDIVYLTEDYNPCGFYRFIPNRRKRLASGGTLQMLAIEGRDRYDTRRDQKDRATFGARWVTIDQPDPKEADVDPSAVYKQGLAKGGATFARLEGACADKNGRIYFTSTSGGDMKGGQIWMYTPDGRDRGQLTLLFESRSRSLLDMPDNVCVMPKSALLFVCEDSDYVGESGTPENLIRVLTPDGRVADFAQNINPEDPRSEIAGTTFSRDGKTLFFNLQRPGLTCAVWGDWSNFRS